MTEFTREIDWPYAQGASVADGAAHFRVWAPAVDTVKIWLEERGRAYVMQRDDEGYCSAHIANIAAGMRYRYELDGERFADPASRCQPDGPQGASMLLDARLWDWRDGDWRGASMPGQVVYELHVGTYTHAGTFEALIAHLPYLKRLGVTLIELMPIGEFEGRWDWGYNGVHPYAPFHGYGTPRQLCRFVEAAHLAGIGVIADVVYNHLGPRGNFLARFSPEYFSERHQTDWGKGINLDGPHCGPVRDFFIDNACYLIREFHLDGLRIDATQALFDDGSPHFLAELSQRARAAAGERSIVLIGENEPQDVICLRPVDKGGWGLDAVWNDDFHHASRVALTGSRDGYFVDYTGTAQELAACLRHGYLFQGQYYSWQSRYRGSQVTDEPACGFVHFLQSHDQVGNSLGGRRVLAVSDAASVRATTALLLLGPQTPMIFMGQEWGAPQPFPFFTDAGGDEGFADSVRKGRDDFVSQFVAMKTERALHAMPDPCDDDTFERARLDPSDVDDAPLTRLHRDLLRVRRELPAIAAQRRELIDVYVFNDRAVAIRWNLPGNEVLLLLNLGADLADLPVSAPLIADPPDRRWRLFWSSEDVAYGGSGIINPRQSDAWRLPGRCATVLLPSDDRERADAERGSPHVLAAARTSPPE
ncbi:malto-oligosyltrehalose trehalohydrolase [Uliginosibacterium sp. sgz301328]|uniref:malto-oligosyltrehalose trehalohydrolase n=1 Tax=Uliginosibacterium sp. sgz301328 TaxID=3243764 RepID=UPI00359D83FB